MLMSNKKDNLPTPFNDLPFGEFLQSIDQFFQNTFQHFNFGFSFPVHQYETNTHYIIEADLPGVTKEQIQLDVYNNHLKIGVQNLEITEEKNDQSEIYKTMKSYQRAERVVMLPQAINENEMKATFKNGVLTIKIPNHKRRIEIE